MRVDHVIWATADLDAAAQRMEREHGLAATGGGAHDGMGTHNRIVPLGGGYLELLAVRDAAEAAGSPLGRAVTARLERVGEGLMAWAAAVAVADVEAAAHPPREGGAAKFRGGVAGPRSRGPRGRCEAGL